MKKFIYTLLISLSLNFTIVNAQTKIDDYNLEEGVYKVSDLESELGKVQYVKNTSENTTFVVIFDNNYTVVQFIKLMPNSPKQKLENIDPSYKIIIIGKDSSVSLS